MGIDNIDVPAATELGIAVCNTPQANSEGVASLAITLLLSVSRRLLENDRFVRAGGWAGKDEFMGYEPNGKTLSIVGTGRIGGRLAQICQSAFDMKVYAYDPYVTAEAMAAQGITKVETVDELLPMADYVSIHTPLTPSTKGIVGAKQFDLMKKTAILLNTSRGPVVDEAALVDALKAGKIAGAGLDVFEQEPPAKDNPLLGMDNVILLAPHGGRDLRVHGAHGDPRGRGHSLRPEGREAQIPDEPGRSGLAHDRLPRGWGDGRNCLHPPSPCLPSPSLFDEAIVESAASPAIRDRHQDALGPASDGLFGSLSRHPCHGQLCAVTASHPR